MHGLSRPCPIPSPLSCIDYPNHPTIFHTLQNVWTLSLLQRMFAALAPARSPTALLGLDSVAAQLVASASNTAERMSVANIGVLLRFELVNVLSAICGDVGAWVLASIVTLPYHPAHPFARTDCTRVRNSA